MDRLKGKVALVTGGAAGIGAEVVRQCVAEGASVAIADVNDDDGQRLAAACGAPARYLHLDVSDARGWDTVVAAAEAAFGPVSVLVNNAGIIDWGGVVEMSAGTFRRLLDVNTVGVFLGMKAVVASMERAGGGSIINMSSSAGMVGGAKTIGYTASKWAVRGMTKAAAVELGPRRIRVNSVHPHVILTPMAAASNAESLGAPPIGRFGQPYDAAMLIVFLASDESGYITGSEHVIDGGALAGWR
ncbi:MAG TPA: SDR family oxidoreductase [Acidimicrobiales bacterium]|nr:SDR family oxidoreductase [Acidimicrobiales bacterium]